MEMPSWSMENAVKPDAPNNGIFDHVASCTLSLFLMCKLMEDTR